MNEFKQISKLINLFIYLFIIYVFIYFFLIRCFRPFKYIPLMSSSRCRKLEFPFDKQHMTFRKRNMTFSLVRRARFKPTLVRYLMYKSQCSYPLADRGPLRSYGEIGQYRKNSKNWDTINYYRDCPTNGIVGFYSALLCLKDADRITNRVDTDQTAP